MSKSKELVPSDIIDAGTAIEAKTKALTSQLIETAKRHRREMAVARSELVQLATEDPDIAASCFYAIPRGGKMIEGPSARFAEMVAYSWGNIQVQGRIVSTDKTHVYAEAQCVDLEKITSATVEVSQRITDKNGNRYNDDMITVTGMATISIAVRNAVFKVVPFSLVKSIYEQARTVAAGKAGSLAQTRQRLLAWFAKVGVDEERLLAKIGKREVKEIGLEEIKTLRGIATALKDNEIDVSEIFPEKPADGTHGFGKKKGEHEPDEKKEAPKEKEPEQRGETDEEKQAMNVRNKLKLVRAAESLDELQSLAEGEERKTVLDAISARAQALQTDEEPAHDPETGEVQDEEPPPPTDSDGGQFGW